DRRVHRGLLQWQAPVLVAGVRLPGPVRIAEIPVHHPYLLFVGNSRSDQQGTIRAPLMSVNISWKLSVEIPSGPSLSLASAVEVHAYDLITVIVPHSAATPPAEVAVDVQPGAAGRVRFLLIRSSTYGDNLQYKVHATGNPARVLNDALLLVGAGSLA